MFCSYHVFLLTVGQTTNERVRRAYGHDGKSPYYESTWRSLRDLCCSQQHPSLLADQSEVLNAKHYLDSIADLHEIVEAMGVNPV